MVAADNNINGEYATATLKIQIQTCSWDRQRYPVCSYVQVTRLMKT